MDWGCWLFWFGVGSFAVAGLLFVLIVLASFRISSVLSREEEERGL